MCYFLQIPKSVKKLTFSPTVFKRCIIPFLQQYVVYADDVNILGGSIHTIKENTEALVVASKEIGLEVNVGTTKYMVMSWDQNAGWSHNIKTDNSSFGRVEEFKYLGKP